MSTLTPTALDLGTSLRGTATRSHTKTCVKASQMGIQPGVRQQVDPVWWDVALWQKEQGRDITAQQQICLETKGDGDGPGHLPWGSERVYAWRAWAASGQAWYPTQALGRTGWVGAGWAC